MKRKEQKGITLIALIITIIIMLILVVVSVLLVINSGLIDRTREAAESTTGAYRNEAHYGEKITIGETEYNSIDEYMAVLLGASATNENHNWVRGEGLGTVTVGDVEVASRDTFTCTCDTCKQFAGSDAGVTLFMGQVLDYTATGTGRTSITSEKSGWHGYDYLDAIDFMDWYNNEATPEEKADEGVQEDLEWAGEILSQQEYIQTIDITDEEVNWVVLGSANLDGKPGNETLLLTTQEPTEDSIVLYGAVPYNSWVTEGNTLGEADRMARELYGNNARAMTIEDVNYCYQYTPVGGIYHDSNDEEQQVSGYTLNQLDIWSSIVENGTLYPDSSSETGYSEDTTTGATILGGFPLNGYYYSLSVGNYLVNLNPYDETYQTTAAERSVIFGASNNFQYWLASRGVSAEEGDAGFGVGAISYWWAYTDLSMFFTDGYMEENEKPFRAVVSITSGIYEALGGWPEPGPYGESRNWIIAWAYDGEEWSNPYAKDSTLLEGYFTDIDTTHSISNESELNDADVVALLYENDTNPVTYTLVICGTGSINCYHDSMGSHPWTGVYFREEYFEPVWDYDFASDFGNKITRLEIREGITEIGNYVFDAMQLEYAKIPSSVEIVGESAFRDCSQLEEVEFINFNGEFDGYDCSEWLGAYWEGNVKTGLQYNYAFYETPWIVQNGTLLNAPGADQYYIVTINGTEWLFVYYID